LIASAVTQCLHGIPHSGPSAPAQVVATCRASSPNGGPYGAVCGSRLKAGATAI
jgi:hypothetical protein